MNEINYKSLSEITVRSQEELDMIPLDFGGRIFVEFGTFFDRAVVKHNYALPVVAWENSSVEARGNSSVEARDNSSVEARGNSQVVDYLQGAKIQISGNARAVFMPKFIYGFMDFYGIKHDKKKAIFYKAVRKRGEEYFSNHDNSFFYELGAIKKEKLEKDTDRECGSGFHISHLAWALDFGSNWNDLAILEVETKISDIVLPMFSDGKVRTSEVKVLREVPLDECGVFGKILAKRMDSRK